MRYRGRGEHTIKELEDIIAELKEAKVSNSASLTGSAALVSEIPENWYISKADLDAEIPYCIAEDADFASGKEPKKLLVHEQFAYYLRRHFCGSKKMQEALEDRGRWEVRSQIKAALGI